MFGFAITLGILSYLLFILGLSNLLYPQVIVGVTVITFLGYFFYSRKELIPPKLSDLSIAKDKELLLIKTLVALQLMIALIGALGPELSFDALWYHLTLPKLYLDYHQVFFIPGNLLHYNTLPKTAEMLYLIPLAFQSEIGAKLIHYGFGILTLVALFKFSRMFYSVKTAWIGVFVMSSNLVFLWEMTTAYNDLARTFFEVMVLWGFVLWLKTKERKWLIEASVMLGLAVTTKLLALGTLGIFSVMIFSIFMMKKQLVSMVKNLSILWGVTILIPLPWFVFSYLHTGNPVYPLFTPQYDTSLPVGFMNPGVMVRDIWQILTAADDPISPLYILSLPLLVYFFRIFSKELRLVAFVSLLGLVVWYITPHTGGGRFLLPYLPAWSFLVAAVYEATKEMRVSIRKFTVTFFSLIVVVGVMSLLYRGLANVRFFPVVLGYESKEAFLSKRLNFSFGDFYDTDGFLRSHLTSQDMVLVYGIHNLYYIEFPFIHETWVQKGNKFNYILAHGHILPERFKYWKLIYYNPVTKVGLYSLGGKSWVY